MLLLFIALSYDLLILNSFDFFFLLYKRDDRLENIPVILYEISQCPKIDIRNSSLSFFLSLNKNIAKF
ncbi:hypothetical protein BpHYR1_041596 [Brachionus plicatilis]|uniref:Uncharacterized protein n=1 Tax=Brachionus plicatilis TaxID=10195 RepID=A0A3M7SS07_BRAPC|nr:hypothetical protein BpHYR1_041596 [Brachionus plicatilis]